MARAPGLVSKLRPLHRRAKAAAFFAERAQLVAANLQTEIDSAAVAKYKEELTGAATMVKGAAKAGETAGLAFVLPRYDKLGAGAMPSEREGRRCKEVRARRSLAAVLWRFSSAGFAAFDGVDGGPAGGDETVHVRAAATLPSLDVVSGSAFAARAREAHLKYERALEWKRDLADFRAGTQVGVNADTQQMMVGRAQPVYTYIPGRAPAPPIAVAIGVAVNAPLDAGGPGSPGSPVRAEGVVLVSGKHHHTTPNM